MATIRNLSPFELNIAYVKSVGTDGAPVVQHHKLIVGGSVNVPDDEARKWSNGRGRSMVNTARGNPGPMVVVAYDDGVSHKVYEDHSNPTPESVANIAAMHAKVPESDDPGEGEDFATMHWQRAVARAEACEDLDQLQDWFAAEERPSVTKALVERIEALTAKA